MSVFTSHRILSWSIVVLILAAVARVCQADEYMDMHMSISFQSSYDASSGGLSLLVVRVRWTVTPKGTRGYELLGDGERIGTGSAGTLATNGRVLYTHYPSRAAFDAAVEQYLAESHTYRLEAQWYDESRGDWKVFYDEYVYEPPEVLQVENSVTGLSPKQPRLFRIQHSQEATEDYDVSNDVLYTPGGEVVNADAYSVIPDLAHGGDLKLVVDSRPRASTSDVRLQLALISADGNALDFPTPTANELRISRPPLSTQYGFDHDAVTIQQYDPCDPSVWFPRWDVKKVMERNVGVVPLADLWGLYDSGVPYAFFTLSFRKPVSADLNDDHATDLRDFAILGKDWGKRDVTSIADIAGVKAMGLPDRNIDGYDLLAFCRTLAGINEWLPHGFEGGQFDDLPWIQGGDTVWRIVSTSAHGGLRSAQAGKVRDGQTSLLMVRLRCGDGKISFWRKVSSEDSGDFLRFRIGTTVIAKWSGESDWQQVSFPVTAGDKIFMWEYVKNGSSSQGADTAWIDDIIFPAK